MGILDNPELIEKLLNIGAPKINKKAQTIDPNAVKNIATKLLSNLDKDFDISTEKTDTALYMKDLQNLDELIGFLLTEGIQYNGKWIVAQNYNTLPADDKQLYMPYKYAGGVEGFAATMQVGIYKDGLIGYLHSIQQKAQSEGGAQGQLLNTMVEKLIGEANDKLKLGMGTKPGEETITDTTPLDSVDIPLDYDNPTTTPRDAGRIIITPAILKSKSTFDDWAKHLTMRKDNKVVEYSNFTDANYCDVLHILFVRATQYAFRHGEALGQYYLQLVNDLAGQYQCQLSTETAPGKSDYKQTGYEEGQQTQLTAQQMQAVQPLITNMPLLGDRIDFPRISRWLKGFASINRDPNTSVDINNAVQILNNIMGTYLVSSQPLSQEAVNIARHIIQNATGKVSQPTNAPTAYLTQLANLMSYMGAILGDLKNKIYDSLPDQEWKNLLDTQISSDASSMYEINNDKIQTWLSDLPSALQSLHTTGF